MNVTPAAHHVLNITISDITVIIFSVDKVFIYIKFLWCIIRCLGRMVDIVYLDNEKAISFNLFTSWLISGLFI